MQCNFSKFKLANKKIASHWAPFKLVVLRYGHVSLQIENKPRVLPFFTARIKEAI